MWYFPRTLVLAPLVAFALAAPGWSDAGPSAGGALPVAGAQAAPATPAGLEGSPTVQSGADSSPPREASEAVPSEEAVLSLPTPPLPASLVAPPAGPSPIQGAFQAGVASWYGGAFNGRLTADGEVYDMSKLTAAHKTLPFDTLVKVTNLLNGKSVLVRVNDRGPYVEGRIIDLSRAAAEAIDMNGVAPVRLDLKGTATPEQFATLVSRETPPVAPAPKPATGVLAATAMPRGSAPAGGSARLPAESTSPVGIVAAAAPSRETPAAAPSGRGGTLRLQLGAFRAAGNASRLAERLASSGLSPRLQTSGGFTRVALVGVTATELPSVRLRLRSLGITGIIVREE